MSRAWPRILSMQRRCKIRILTLSGAATVGRWPEAVAAGAGGKTRARTRPAAASQQVHSRLLGAALWLRGQKERRRPGFMLLLGHDGGAIFPPARGCVAPP